ncbi:helix-turn-helix domain-containing protein [Flammeovirga sp. EKP202]|uniref:helix-turn-helix domain-containing protein n=1 Tax=Flammeovirga sp. EKP202 TaxID=2770592 RepID=UPI00165EEA44|nr:helix-turn-helix domain-containing protein [Flammeovirga sp. EKP202]MBD0405288.1 helix-turn-helix domain-containing protein [Flammeovirga sp. EKP202]
MNDAMKMNYYQRLSTYFTFICTFFLSTSVEAVHFVIHQLPLHHPQEASLFLVGSFNAWNPSDTKYQFHRNQKGQWVTSISSSLNAFEYKITRGSWEKVESTQDGKPKANRVFISENEADTVFIDVLGWEDLAGQTTILLEELPASTPYESRFFLTGDFNNWDPFNTEYQFQKNGEGVYALTLPSTISQFQFKVTRGSWSSTECLSNGKYRPNRAYFHQSKGPETIILQIEDWEDVYKGKVWGLTPLTQFILFHLLLLFIYFSWINYEHSQFKMSLLIIGLSFGITLLFATSLFMPLKNSLNGLHLVHDLFIPVLFIAIGVIQNYTFRYTQWKSYKRGVYVLSISLLLVVSLYVYQEEPLLTTFLERKYPVLNLFIKLIVLAVVMYTWNISRQKLTKYNTETLQGSVVKMAKEAFLLYQKSVVVLMGVFIISIVIQAYRSVLSPSDFLLQDLSDDIIWYATFIYMVFLSGWVFRYHALLKPVELKSSYRKEDVPSNDKELTVFMEQVSVLFEKEQLYTKQDLTLNEVSTIMSIPSHKLTKLIQQSYKKNFSELVNDYRVKAFTQKVMMGEAEKSTLLSIAYEVGFHSKSTFNRAFKKSTGMTPKEFMNKSSVKKILEE